MHAIVIRGAGGKAFCAGGDVKGVVQMILAGRQAEALRCGTPALLLHACTANGLQWHPCFLACKAHGVQLAS